MQGQWKLFIPNRHFSANLHQSEFYTLSLWSKPMKWSCPWVTAGRWTLPCPVLAMVILLVCHQCLSARQPAGGSLKTQKCHCLPVGREEQDVALAQGVGTPLLLLEIFPTAMTSPGWGAYVWGMYETVFGVFSCVKWEPGIFWQCTTTWCLHLMHFNLFN